MGKVESSRGTSFCAEALEMFAVARVAIVSNLPQLDKLFDYIIPEHLHSQTKVGSRVKIPFGKGTKLYDGFVFEIEKTSSFNGSLSELAEVVGERSLLAPELIDVLRELAARSASSVGELLKLAVPGHMPRAYKAHSLPSPEVSISVEPDSPIDDALTSSLVVSGTRHAILAKPSAVEMVVGSNSHSYPYWVVLFCVTAIANLRAGKSTILAVPDFRDQEILLQALEFSKLGEFLASFGTEQTKSQSYEAYLRALDNSPCVVVGSRSVVLAPAHNLGTIALFDEADDSFTDQSSPYLNARDVSLVRQSIQGCSLVFASHSRSTDIQRLVESGYLQESTPEFARPRISVSEPSFRVDSHAFNAIRSGLDKGSVLVQVASRGESTSLFCVSCDKRIVCANCSGPAWVDSAGNRKCRWCNAFVPVVACECGSLEVGQGRAGSTRTAAELGRSFSGAKVVESTGDNRVLHVSAGKNLVIATAGAEPFVVGGYQAVVILDAQATLARQNLRASEEAVRLWSNAVSKLAIDGEAVLVGVAGSLAQKFCLWQQVEIAAEELTSRRELLLPPALRLGSIAGSHAMLVELATSLSASALVTVFGPAPQAKGSDPSEWRLIIKYNYSDTLEVAKLLKGEAIRLSRGKAAVAASGRAVRALKIRMSDGDVI